MRVLVYARAMKIFALVVAACIIATACEPRETNSPNVLEQTANDVEQEVDGAGETVEKVGDDVDTAASDAVDGAD